MSKILWFSSLLEGKLPSNKDENHSILLNQALVSKKESIFKDNIQAGGWVVKAFSKNFNELIFDIRWGQFPFQ